MDMLPTTSSEAGKEASTTPSPSPATLRITSVDRRRRRRRLEHSTRIFSPYNHHCHHPHHYPPFTALGVLITSLALLLLLLLGGVHCQYTDPNRLSSFTSEHERHTVRQLFLKRFGLEHLGEAMHGGWEPSSSTTSRPQLPTYMWDLYADAVERGELETIRHYRPSNASDIGGGVLQLDFNLTAGSGGKEEEVVVGERGG